MKLVGIALALTLCSSCAIGSRVLTGYGAIADAPGCGAVLTTIAVLVDSTLAGAMLYDGEVSPAEQVGLIFLGADVLVGGVDAIQTCMDD